MAEPLVSNLQIMDLLLPCKGRPVRVSLFDQVYRDRLGKYPGVLADISADCIRVDCLDTLPVLPIGVAATVEIAKEGRLYWCHTSTLPAGGCGPHQLRLAWPDKLQTEQQRSSPRAEAYLPVHYIFPDTLVAHQGLIVNISASGAALQGSVQPEPGQVLALMFSLGSGHFFQDIQAEVVRVTSTRAGSWNVGLRFLTLNEEQAEELAQWVLKHAQQPQG